MRVAISSCLLGEPCRYDGRAKLCTEVMALAERVRARGGEVVPVCPECAGGLATPRLPAEIVDGRVLMRDGTDVTEAFERGARRALARVRPHKMTPFAVLKAKSPSCGVGLVYDGTYSATLVAGDGVFARLLREEGVPMATEETVRACTPSVEHPVAIVLGTGLGHLAGLVKPVRRIDYHDIDGFPEDARPVAGHSFEATIGTIDGVPVIVYPGKVHLYQGYSAQEVSSLVAHAHKLGCRTIVFVCATGAIEGMAQPGLGIVEDHLNLTGANPLDGTELVSMSEVYSPYLRGIAQGVAADEGIELGGGVLAGVRGPSFETPAEVRALRALGASYVGMSCVCEAILAHALGMNVLGLTLAANYAGDPEASHQTVLAAARGYADSFERLVRGVLAML